MGRQQYYGTEPQRRFKADFCGACFGVISSVASSPKTSGAKYVALDNFVSSLLPHTCLSLILDKRTAKIDALTLKIQRTMYHLRKTPAIQFEVFQC